MTAKTITSQSHPEENKERGSGWERWDNCSRQLWGEGRQQNSKSGFFLSAQIREQWAKPLPVGKGSSLAGERGAGTRLQSRPCSGASVGSPRARTEHPPAALPSPCLLGGRTLLRGRV